MGDALSCSCGECRVCCGVTRRQCCGSTDCERSCKWVTEGAVLQNIKTVFEDLRNICILKLVEICNICVLFPGLSFCVCFV